MRTKSTTENQLSLTQAAEALCVDINDLRVMISDAGIRPSRLNGEVVLSQAEVRKIKKAITETYPGMDHMRIEEAAQWAGVSVAEIQRYVKKGVLPCVWLPKRPGAGDGVESHVAAVPLETLRRLIFDVPTRVVSAESKETAPLREKAERKAATPSLKEAPVEQKSFVSVKEASRVTGIPWWRIYAYINKALIECRTIPYPDSINHATIMAVSIEELKVVDDRRKASMKEPPLSTREQQKTKVDRPLGMYANERIIYEGEEVEFVPEFIPEASAQKAEKTVVAEQSLSSTPSNVVILDLAKYDAILEEVIVLRKTNAALESQVQDLAARVAPTVNGDSSQPIQKPVKQDLMSIINRIAAFPVN